MVIISRLHVVILSQLHMETVRHRHVWVLAGAWRSSTLTSPTTERYRICSYTYAYSGCIGTTYHGKVPHMQQHVRILWVHRHYILRMR